MTPRGESIFARPAPQEDTEDQCQTPDALGLGSREHSAIDVLFARGTKNSLGLKEWFGASGVGVNASSNFFCARSYP